MLLSFAIAGSALIAWTSTQFWKLPEIGQRQRDYYNLLVSGFQKGSLAMDIPVPEALRTSKNPWDPKNWPTSGIPQDVSYFKGHFYLYFGVVPAVTLFWPFRAVFGLDLPLVYAHLAYSVGAFVLAAWLWLRIVRDFLHRAGLTTRLAGIAAIGLGGGQLDLARRVSIWEMPIAAGHFYMMCMLAAGYMALRSRRPWAWLAASGLALGLAIGCRPTLVGAAAGVAVLCIAMGAGKFEEGGWREFARRGILAAAAAGLPLAAVVAGLLAYNHARFGSLFEFGLNYQLTGSYVAKATHFSPSFVPYNFSVYFLAPPQWGRYFPFLHPIAPTAQPKGYYGIEYVYGALVVCPVLWWAVCLPGCIRSFFRGSAFAAFAGLLFATALSTTAILLCFDTAAARYTVDFLPWWVWLGVLGWAVLENRITDGPGVGGAARGALRASFSASVAVTCLLAFFASVELHDILIFFNPSAYWGLSRIFNAPTALIEGLTGYRGGPVEMDVAFAMRNSGSYEPLVITGVSYQKDFAFIFFESATRVRLGYFSSGETTYMSDDFNVVPGRPYHVRVSFGALYPPSGALRDKGWSNRDIELFKNWLDIEVDGRLVLMARAPWHDASPGTVEVGRDVRGLTYGVRFSGTLSRVRRGEWRRPDFGMRPDGDFKIGLILPEDVIPGVEPVATAGHPGRADIIGMRMLDRRTYTLVYESWGGGTVESGPMTATKNRLADLRIRMGPLLKLDDHSPLAILRRTLVVWRDGRPVMWLHTMIPLDQEVRFGVLENDVASTLLTPEYRGRLEAFSREPAVRAWAKGPFSAVEMDLIGRGVGSEPIAASGVKGRSDLLAIDWIGDAKARLLYAHDGDPIRASQPFAWSDGKIQLLRVELPSFRALDTGSPAGTEGRLSARVDGVSVWEQTVPYFAASSESVSVGRNEVGCTYTGAELHCVVADVRQVPR